LFTIGGGPSVSGYGNLGFPFSLDNGGGRPPLSIGVFGGMGGASGLTNPPSALLLGDDVARGVVVP